MTDQRDAPTEPAQQPEQELPEQMAVRAEKRAQIIAAGGSPYPLHVPRTVSLAQVRERFDHAGEGGGELPPDTRTGETVSVAGRVIFTRNTGKLCFARLREGDAELQAMLSLADLGQERLDDYKALVDIGDLLSVSGEVITSRRGELSVQVTDWTFAAKALRPLPNAHSELSEEARVRQRYVDLIVRDEAREMVRIKARVLRSLRATLDAAGYLEVETGILQATNGGAAARPFSTHVNALDTDMLLRIALELPLKRALVGGLEKVYEIGRIFRNEGIDSTHSAEFSMLEAYGAFGDYRTMMELIRELVLNAARAIGATTVPVRGGGSVDLEQPWREATVLGLVSDAVGEQVTTATPVEDLRRLAAAHDVALRPDWSVDEILLELYEQLAEHTLIEPTFVCDYPASVRPLAKPHREDPSLNEAWDLVVGGVELGVAYSELNDPVVQRDRLTEQSLLAAAGDPEAMDLDEDFLRAMEYGMPPAGGLGMGVDRLIMLLTGKGIRETILFPMLRPE